MESTRKARGPAAPQGEATTDPRLHYQMPDDGTPLFKHTSITPPFPVVRRSDIQRAAYNPRMMNQAAKKELRERLKKYGLVNRLVWNTRTGVLVGGHQRLEQMDKLQGYPQKCPDYLIPVDPNDLDEIREKEINVLLNNTNQQGTWDTGALQELFESGADPFAAGFSGLDLELMLGGDLAQQLEATFGTPDTESDPDRASTTDDGQGDLEAVKQERNTVQAIKDRRKEAKAADREDDGPDHILHIVFNGPRDLKAWLKQNALPPDARYLASERLDAIITETIENGINAALDGE